MTGPADPPDAAELREQLVRQLEADGTLSDARIAAALRAVPRHAFLPGVELERAYRDDAVVTKTGADDRAISSSSQPAIMALMLAQLGVEPGHRVLEIGAGTGYNAALLARLAGPAGQVTTVDLDEDTAAAARAHLHGCGFGAVRVIAADGWLGWPQDAPYDRIILAVGAWDIAPAWIEQLRQGGRLVLPLSLRPGTQYSVAFDRAADQLASVSVIPCGFMTLRGPFAGPDLAVRLSDGSGVTAEVGVRPDGADPVADLLAQPGPDVTAGITVTTRDLWAGLGLWLAAAEPGMGRLSSFGGAARPGVAGPIPAGWAGTGLLAGAHGCAALVAMGGDDADGPFELGVRPFGPDGAALAARLVGLARGWAAAGRPSPAELRISASPFGKKIFPGQGETVIEKEQTRLLMRWVPRAAGGEP
ncbi:MAG TPA: methyltransferase, FxLD system [Streptosporangiaceae bacterium]|jgi:protein-L-isoaspartate(D-aspartate) O-methyltransferase